MSNSNLETDATEDAFESIEAMVRAAGNYVVPSDDLRPRTLEAAREICRIKRTERKLGGFVLTSLCFCLLSMPLADCLVVWRSHSLAPSAMEMQRRALQITTEPDSNPSWGLMEAFDELRRLQAARLGVVGL